MSTPIDRTLDVLARSQEKSAATIFSYALGRDDEIGVSAALAAGRYGSRRLKSEVIRRVNELSTRQRDALQGNSGPFVETVLLDLEGNDDELRIAAIRWVAAVDDFSLFRKLIERLVVAEETELPHLTETLESLTDRMYDHLTSRDYGSSDRYMMRNAPEIRAEMYDAVMTALEALAEQPCPDRLVEWALILTDHEAPIAARLFTKFGEKEGKRIAASLMTSVHPGVLRCSMELMKRTYPFEIAFEVFKTRDDEAFIHSLLRTFPLKLSSTQKHNLALIDSLPWLSGSEQDFSNIPNVLHQGLVRLISALGLPEEKRQASLRWLLKNGDHETREIASSHFDDLAESESHEILLGSLDHTDADVQVWATSHLRGQKVPDAFALLIKRLDSEIAEVRDAARKELSDLNLNRALRMMEATPDKVTPPFGELLKKINPDICLELRREYTHAIRGRRVNALRAALALGYSEETVSGISVLVQDTDMLVRRTAVEVLAQTPVRESVSALITATGDRSPRVQQAAVQALETLKVLIAKRQAEAATASAENENDHPHSDAAIASDECETSAEVDESLKTQTETAQ